MTLDELIAWVSEQAARNNRYAAEYADEYGDDLQAAARRNEAATLTSVENALRRLAQIERDHGGAHE